MALKQEQIDQIKAGLAQGLPPGAIATLVGCTRATIYNWMKSGKLGEVHPRRREKKRLPPVERFEQEAPAAEGVVPEQEFGQMLIQVRPKLLYWAIPVVGSRATAEDYVSQAFVNALARRESFQAGTNFHAWLFTILRNLIYSGSRERQRRPSVAFVESSHSTPETTTSTTLAHETIVLIVTKLNWVQRDTLLAIGYEGLSYEEVAQRYRVSIGTVKSRLWRARARIRQLLEASAP